MEERSQGGRYRVSKCERMDKRGGVDIPKDDPYGTVEKSG